MSHICLHAYPALFTNILNHYLAYICYAFYDSILRVFLFYTGTTTEHHYIVYMVLSSLINEDFLNTSEYCWVCYRFWKDVRGNMSIDYERTEGDVWRATLTNSWQMSADQWSGTRIFQDWTNER